MCALCQILPPGLAERAILYPYLDPGTGFVIQSSLPFTLGAVLSGLTILFFFFKRNWKKVLVIFTLIGISSWILYTLSTMNPQKNGRRVVVIGIDALDPKLIDEGIEKGVLPTFAKLKKTGYYSKLGTTTPPQSPVAWASFSTGVLPAKHGVYDFIVRDPENLQLDLVWSDKIENILKSPPFWEETYKKNIPTTLLFLPNTYPAPTHVTKLLSGMGTPDVTGTAGVYTLITTKKIDNLEKLRGKVQVVPDKETTTALLYGPKYTSYDKTTKPLEIPVIISISKKTKSVVLDIQGKKINLSENKFSEWITVDFSPNLFTHISGNVYFHLNSASPLSLYVSPINFDPQKPIYPVSQPNSYSAEIARRYGPYHTQGMPYDTWALEEDALSEKAFLENAHHIFNEHSKIILGELDKTSSGIFFGYVENVDIIQHMFWKNKSVVLQEYQLADNFLKEVLAKLKETDTLLVLSDHGFASFDYEFSLNTWLKQEGYLSLMADKSIGSELLSDISWKSTKAYGIGYNSLYFNIKGREQYGTVRSDEVEKLTAELKEKLLAFTNPETEEKVIKAVYTRADLGIPASDSSAPDIILGFYSGTRTSWESAVGAVPENVLQPRTSKWNGDHLFDASEVPGVLFSNKLLPLVSPNITDIMPYTLTLFKK